jgi:hypothetical protein
MADQDEGQKPAEQDAPAYDPNVSIESTDPADEGINAPPEEPAAEAKPAEGDAASSDEGDGSAEGDAGGEGDDEGLSAEADESGGEAEGDESGAEAKGDDDAGEGDDAKPRKRTRRKRSQKYQYAIRRAYKAEAEKRELEQRVQELEGRQGDRPAPRAVDAPPPKETNTEAPKPPNRDDFDDVEDFIVAKTKFEVAQEFEDRLKAERVATEARLVADRDRQAAAEAEEAEAQQLTDWQSKVDETAESIPDFDAVIDANKDVPVSAPMRDFMLESDAGPQMLYELAKDAELAEEINGLPPLRALAAMARLEARVSGGGQAPGAPAPKPKPRLPKPPTPVGGGATSVPVDLENADYQTYAKVMNKREQEQRQHGR